MGHLLSVVLSPLLVFFHDLDIRLLREIYENRNPEFDSTFIIITNSVAAMAFGLPLIVLITGLVTKKRTLWKNALTILISVSASAIVANILKYSLDMPRPYELYPFIEKLSTGGSPSFPSGHTADAFAFAIALGLIYPKWYFIFPAILWALLVGCSRMWLGVHFPSDVLAGAFIGSVCAVVYTQADKRMRAKKE